MPAQRPTPAPRAAPGAAPGQAPAPRRARHLMDPAHPQRQVNDHKLTQVQRWVMSSLAVVTILHLSAGLVVAAVYLDPDFPDARIGLNVIAGLFAACAVLVARAVHQRPLLTWWLLLAVATTGVGLLVTFA